MQSAYNFRQLKLLLCCENWPDDLADERIKLLNDPHLPIIRNQARRLFSATLDDGALAQAVHDWLCDVHGYEFFKAEKLKLHEVVELLRAADAFRTKKPKVPKTSPNDPRNKWLAKQLDKGRDIDSIIDELSEIAPGRHWGIISTQQGIRQAAAPHRKKVAEQAAK